MVMGGFVCRPPLRKRRHGKVASLVTIFSVLLCALLALRICFQSGAHSGRAWSACGGRYAISRKRHVFASVVGMLLPQSARAELPPPVQAIVDRYRDQLEDGADWLFFVLKPLLVGNEDGWDLIGATKLLTSDGSTTTILDRDITLPIEQIGLGSGDLDLGWEKAKSKIDEAKAKLKAALRVVNGKGDLIGDQNAALDAWEDLRATIEELFTSVNEQQEEPIFTLPSAEYANRKDAYMKRQKVLIRMKGKGLGGIR